jgi:1-acyl-sn-glycerol-3-phosphate acyltransferase
MDNKLEKKLRKRSFGYTLFRNLYILPAIYLFYRKILVFGTENIPDKGAVIFTPNHQNALMDALLVLCCKNRQPVFVARADIFQKQKQMIIKFLHFLRILPIYRKRDGGNSLDNNQETFELIVKVLDSGQAVGIMPEGTHSELKRLRMLQKGLFRLSMQVQEKYENEPMVKIVPVGLEFTSTNKFRADVTIKFGKPIEVSDFYNLYVENQAKAYKKMQNHLSEKIKELMINIENTQFYLQINDLRILYGQQSTSRNRLQAEQKIIAALEKYAQTEPDEMAALSDATDKYTDILLAHNLRDWVVRKQPYSPLALLVRSLIAIVGIPFWICGLIFNYIPYKLTALASTKIEDPQFVSSVLFVVGIVVFPLYYLLSISLCFILIPCIYGKITIALSMFPLGMFAYRYYISMKKLSARFRFYKNRKSDQMLEAVKLREYIFGKLTMMG